MTTKGMIDEFDWDTGNIDKNYKKHGITPNEAEEVFLDEHIQIKKDIRHGQTEDRFIAIGQTQETKILFLIFAFRGNKIRIISARIANKKERSVYEKKA